MKNPLSPSVCCVAVALAGQVSLATDLVEPEELPTPSDIEIDFGLSLQFRYTTSVAPDAPEPADDPSLGFSYRRVRPSIEFNAFDGKLLMFVQADAPNAGPTRILELYAAHEINDDWSISGGQIRLAFNREMWVSSKRQMAVDRGSVANNINPGQTDRLYGIELKYEAEPYRVFFTVGEGFDSAWTSYNQPKPDWSVTLRAETLLIGDNFNQFKQYTAPRGTARGLLLGAAAHVQQTPGAGDRVAWTADLGYQENGFNAMIMGGGHVSEDRNAAAVMEPESLYGIAGHLGAYVAEDVEPFVRYEWGTTSDETHPDLSVLTAGVNWYIIGHILKVVADASIAFDGVGPALNRSSDGLLETPAGDDRFIFRAQLQMVF